MAEGYGGLSLPDLISFGPAIVPVRINQAYDHFVVFRGMLEDRVILADPAFGNRSMSVREFLEIWQKHIAFIVRKRGEVKAEQGELAIHRQALVFPSNGMIRQALP